MGAELVSTRDIYNVIHRTLGFIDNKILTHGEITGYIFYNMLRATDNFSNTELAEYALIGLLHDIGMVKTGYQDDFVKCETSNVWAHSTYGYLFLKYLSPVENKAEIVLYHHLPYCMHSMIKSSHLKETECLTLADSMDVFMRMEDNGMEKDYFVKQFNVKFSAAAIELFQTAQSKYHFMEKLKTNEYMEEMAALFDQEVFSEKQKKGFLGMLVYSIDFRSQQTVFHTMSTRAFALEIGRLIRVSPMDLQILYYGSLLHDIGKIAIPLSILEAPRKLNIEEMRIMKAHVVITDMILNGYLNNKIVKVAVRHHEKLDGTGYPAGLKGEELSQLERITAVADILSALYGKRSYKDSYEPEQIIEILKTDAKENKICSKVVDVVVSNYDTIIKNYEKARNETMDKYMEIINQYDSIYERFKEFET
ncbi:MAG TPA: HD domain-containing phosphohydrolase [Lachnospiraceae bacterium]|nr:HD domain-containing phosphohydrolase [Lachnospiraceae bacterium]